LTEVGSARSVPGTQQAGFHTNNGGMGGAMEDGDVGTNPQRTGGDDSRDDYTYSDGTSISVPKGDSPPSDTSGFSSDGGGAKGGLGRVWAVICQAAGCGGGDGDSTERAVTGTRGQGNPLDFGTSGGASTNGNGKTVNLGSRGGNDGGGSDQGGRSGAATANGTGQTVNRGNKGGGDALAQGPAPAEQLNGNKLLNGAVDPKRDGPH
jgi:hypothetical protein